MKIEDEDSTESTQVEDEEGTENTRSKWSLLGELVVGRGAVESSRSHWNGREEGVEMQSVVRNHKESSERAF